ncbi:PREDICTED: cuticle protein 19.8-like [Papilio polytes]|uniref:cuticle protein 19.8-like n=1 Tax=Papilio polytes TaxID=76194 RepID=UPI00067657CD|nr:PREDICTED: cuticle protein 19.8-like [Papilio polytes]
MWCVIASACFIPAVISIIVTDYPPTSTEYNYSYNVVNPSTGDAKSVHETRQGNTVTGSYSLIDPDGTRRTVKYIAGPKIGFKAVVHSEPETPYNPPIPVPPNPQPLVRLTPITYVHKILPRPIYVPVTTNNRSYFTPGSTVADRPALNEGEYFEPNKDYYHSNRI